MKKILLILCGALLVMTACKKNENVYTVNGFTEDPELNGQWIYMYDLCNDNALLDSALIENGQFHFSDTISDAILAQLKIGDEKKLTFILEVGQINAYFDKDSLSGTPLNEELSKYYANHKVFSKQMDDLFAEYYSLTLPQDSVRAQELSDLYDTLALKDKNANIESFKQNKNNVLGLFLSRKIRFETLAEYDELMEGAAPIITEYPKNVQTRSFLENLDNTSVGKHYSDIDVIEFATGETKKLSEFIDGKIALIDFWASWCRPCREEIPNVANINKKYGKKMVVISLNVWDQPDKQAEAIKEMGMNWLMLSDTTKISTNTYGISGIPQILLIGADGTIIARDLRDKAIEEAVIEATK